jgi:hypothetical protein
MFNRTIRFILLVIMLASAVMWLSAGCNMNNRVNIGDKNMTTTAPKIPPIDMIAPVKKETATFALG